MSDESPPRVPSGPVVGVGAVVFDEERVLLVKRGHPPLIGAWSLPGGRVEWGETLSAAVARELFEETGVIAEVGPLVDAVDRIHLTPDGEVEYHFVVVDYLCEPRSPSLTPGSDADAARWVAVTELSSYAVSSAAVAVIRKALDMRRKGRPAPSGPD